MKKENPFWVGYADLMTSLFFVMLVLFVVSIGYLVNVKKDLENNLKETKIKMKDLEEILELDKQFKPLEESDEFIYLTECKKFIAKDLVGKELFESNRIEILPDLINKTVETGFVLQNFLTHLNAQNPSISYLLVIEGNMANSYDKRFGLDETYAYELSYKRALAVYTLWQNNGIDLRKYNVEVMICGSGFNGLCRDGIEENNKRFSIQIIPKINRKNRQE